jgi:signal transduction histidine kinase
MTAPLPANEQARLAALRNLTILDTPPEESFDRVTRLAAKLFRAPTALISLVDEHRQWFKSSFNFSYRETCREDSFCAHALLGDSVMVVPDAVSDARFADNPGVTGAPGIRFYAGAPLKSPTGFNIGTLCIIDAVPRDFTPEDRALLNDLAAMVNDELALRHASNVRLQLVDRLETALAKLKQAEALRDDFTHMLVHDLRNPLSVMIGFFELLRMTAAQKLSASELEQVTIVEESADRLNAMITSLLDVHRLEEGEMPIEMIACDLREVARTATQAARELRNGSFSLQLPASPVIAPADANLIERVIANLVSNALKFTTPQQHVRVSVEAEGANVRVSVIDEGPGIPPELHSCVFDKFGQIEGRNCVHSSGLGLTFCKLAVEAHGGTIGIESVVGKGSTFSFTLPGRQMGLGA